MIPFIFFCFLFIFLRRRVFLWTLRLQKIRLYIAEGDNRLAHLFLLIIVNQILNISEVNTGLPSRLIVVFPFHEVLNSSLSETLVKHFLHFIFNFLAITGLATLSSDG